LDYIGSFNPKDLLSNVKNIAPVKQIIIIKHTPI
jgi:hypothetical protein